MASPSPSYTIQQVLPAQPGWRIVYWRNLAHATAPCYLFALATDASTQTPGLIVSLTYTPGLGWTCAEQDPTFCGLMPPGMIMETYEGQDPHGHGGSA